MDLKNLEQILNSKKIPAINKLVGTNFSIYEYPKEIKMNIIKEECRNRNMKICESEDDQILAIFENKTACDSEQLELIELLFKHNIIAIPLN